MLIDLHIPTRSEFIAKAGSPEKVAEYAKNFSNPQYLMKTLGLTQEQAQNMGASYFEIKTDDNDWTKYINGQRYLREGATVSLKIGGGLWDTRNKLFKSVLTVDEVDDFLGLEWKNFKEGAMTGEGYNVVADTAGEEALLVNLYESSPYQAMMMGAVTTNDSSTASFYGNSVDSDNGAMFGEVAADGMIKSATVITASQWKTTDRYEDSRYVVERQVNDNLECVSMSFDVNGTNNTLSLYTTNDGEVMGLFSEVAGEKPVSLIDDEAEDYDAEVAVFAPQIKRMYDMLVQSYVAGNEYTKAAVLEARKDRILSQYEPVSNDSVAGL